MPCQDNSRQLCWIYYFDFVLNIYSLLEGGDREREKKEKKAPDTNHVVDVWFFFIVSYFFLFVLGVMTQIRA